VCVRGGVCFVSIYVHVYIYHRCWRQRSLTDIYVHVVPVSVSVPVCLCVRARVCAFECVRELCCIFRCLSFAAVDANALQLVCMSYMCVYVCVCVCVCVRVNEFISPFYHCSF